MASNLVNVNITTQDGLFTLVAKLDRIRLIRFADLAATQIKNGAPSNPRLPKHAVTLPQGAVDEKAAARITTWIATNDISKPKQLTLSGLGLEHFDDIVYTYAMAYAFRLKRELRGDDLRNAIYDYMHQGCLSFDEFALIVEWLAFDGGLVKTAMHEVIFRCCKGGYCVPPEMARIEGYCKGAGLWEEIKGIEADILAKMEEKDRRDAEAARVGREQRLGR